MIKSYFKIAWRSIVRNRTFSIINLAGLALGITCSMFIFLWIKDEYSVDNFHAKGDRLYRIYERQYFNGAMQGVVWTQGPLAAELKSKIPEIVRATPFSWTSTQVFAVGDKVNKVGVNTAGPDFFSMFSFPMVAGTAQNALQNRNSLAISEHMAKMYFGNAQSAIGQTIRYDNRKDFIIAAVFQDIPANSTLQFDCLMNWDAYVEDNDWAKTWGSTDPLTFFELRPDADPSVVQKKLTHFLDLYLGDQDPQHRAELGVQPFGDYYLYGNFKDGHIAEGRIRYVRIFLIVAVFILLIACINFMNLSTAGSARRAREVGIRKAIGARKGKLIAQFLGESVLMAGISGIFAVLLVSMLLPAFNNLTGKQVQWPFNNALFLLKWLGLVLFTGILAGSYPAFLLSNYKPIIVLRKQFRLNPGSSMFRKGLVVFQFSLSIIMIAGMLVVNRQVHFIQTSNPGFDREDLLYLPMEGNLLSQYDVFKTELLKVPGVKKVSSMTETPVSMNYGMEGVKWPGADPNETIRFTPVGAGYDFIETMHLHLAAGRGFSPDFPGDSNSILLNETAIRVMNLSDPVGKQITVRSRPATIIGVIKDFHFQSYHSAIRPLFVYLRKSPSEGSLLVRASGRQMAATIAGMKKVCEALNPAFPFQYHFADLEYARLYNNEQLVSKLSAIFAALAIFVSCIGLLGLALFEAQQRNKEVSIRKVLGANLGSLMVLLCREFLFLVGIAILIGTPIAWWASGNWLSDFAYQAPIRWWIYAIAGVFALLVTAFTIGFQMWRVARGNVLSSLRSE